MEDPSRHRVRKGPADESAGTYHLVPSRGVHGVRAVLHVRGERGERGHQHRIRVHLTRDRARRSERRLDRLRIRLSSLHRSLVRRGGCRGGCRGGRLRFGEFTFSLRLVVVLLALPGFAHRRGCFRDFLRLPGRFLPSLLRGFLRLLRLRLGRALEHPVFDDFKLHGVLRRDVRAGLREPLEGHNLGRHRLISRQMLTLCENHRRGAFRHLGADEPARANRRLEPVRAHPVLTTSKRLERREHQPSVLADQLHDVRALVRGPNLKRGELLGARGERRG